MDLALNNLQRLICHKTQPTNQHIFLITFLNETELIIWTQLNGFSYFYLIRIILFIINHLFAHSLMFSSIAMYH